MSLKYEQWPSTPISIGNSAFVDVYTATGPRVTFLKAIFQTNSDKMLIRVLLDGSVILDLDMDELVKDFKVRGGGAGARFCLKPYGSKRWEFLPMIPIEADNEIKIQMRAVSGTKKVERGISVLRTRQLPGGGG